MKGRIHNFSAGPAAIPLPVLKRIKQELLNFNGSGISIMEISHRSKHFGDLMDEVVGRIKLLMNLVDEHYVLFIQGGASMQFVFLPMNLCANKRPAYINTGTWTTKAIEEAAIQGKEPLILASSEDRIFCYIPTEYDIPEDVAYLHIVSNNTIEGTQWQKLPKSQVPLVVDMSSDIFSRPMNYASCGLIFAGAQKNLGLAGVCLVVIRKDLMERVPGNLPNMLTYKTYVDKNSMYNTPPTFAIYVVNQVLKWLAEDVGGVENMAAINQKKAKTLYGAIDASSGFYRATADKDSRSQMNVTFRLADEQLEHKFIAEAAWAGLSGLKGHRSVGGCRASLYNAVPQEAVEALVEFMKDFMRRCG